MLRSEYFRCCLEVVTRIGPMSPSLLQVEIGPHKHAKMSRFCLFHHKSRRSRAMIGCS